MPSLLLLIYSDEKSCEEEGGSFQQCPAMMLRSILLSNLMVAIIPFAPTLFHSKLMLFHYYPKRVPANNIFLQIVMRSLCKLSPQMNLIALFRCSRLVFSPRAHGSRKLFASYFFYPKSTAR